MARPKRKKQRDQDLINERRTKEGRNKTSDLLSTDENITARNVSAGFTPEGGKFVGQDKALEIKGSGKTTQQFEEEERMQQAEDVKVAEETGVFENRPDRVELDVTPEDIAGRKDITEQESINALTTSIFQRNKEVEEYDIIADDLGLDKGIPDLMKNPETARQLTLQEIQREELDRSLSFNQKIGSMLEPYLGELKVFDFDVGAYVDQWVQMPTRDVDTIVDQITEMESSVSGMTDSASQGEIGNPQEVLRDIAGKEEMLARYEARIKRLIIESDELRANPEKVNIIEEQILSARETFFEAKQRAAEGALITPSNEQLYARLREVRDEFQ